MRRIDTDSGASDRNRPACWHVYLYGIMWDDGKGEYDVSELPDNLRVTVHCDDAQSKQEALEIALDAATDEFGMLIEGTEQILFMPIYR